MKHIIILSLFLFIIPITFAYFDLTQAQLDSLSGLTWQTLQCTSDGSISMSRNSLYTPYSCYDFTIVGDIYRFDFVNHTTMIPVPIVMRYYDYVQEDEPYNMTVPEALVATERYYWDLVGMKALRRIDQIINKIYSYQTRGSSMYDDWRGDIFG